MIPSTTSLSRRSLCPIHLLQFPPPNSAQDSGTSHFKMCIALALGSMMKKKKDEPNSQEPNIHVVSAKRPDNVYPCVPKKTGVPKKIMSTWT